jgi:hypothetical protein
MHYISTKLHFRIRCVDFSIPICLHDVPIPKFRKDLHLQLANPEPGMLPAHNILRERIYQTAPRRTSALNMKELKQKSQNDCLASMFIMHASYRDSQSVIMTITPWPESASKLYRLSDHRLSAKLVPPFVDKGV